MRVYGGSAPGTVFLCVLGFITLGRAFVVTGRAGLPASLSQAKETEIALKLDASFPAKEGDAESIFFGATHIDTAGSDRIVITDSRAHIIKVFDTSGKPILQFGRKGQGPGEFMNPARVVARGDRLFVHDIRNRRIQVFDSEGRYLSGFKLTKSYVDLAVDEAGNVYAASLPKFIDTALPPDLLDVLDSTGKFLRSFNPRLKEPAPNQTFSMTRITMNEEEEVHVAFLYHPIVRKFSRVGKLLFEARLDHSSLLNGERHNIRQRQKEKQGQRVGYVHLFEAIRTSPGGTYLLSVDPALRIFKISPAGFLEKIYFYPSTPSEFYALDFAVVEKAGGPVFYILQTAPENIVCVFIPG